MIEEKEFTCAACDGEFLSNRADEEAKAEFKENFPDEADDGEPREIICDDCFEKMKGYFGWDQA